MIEMPIVKLMLPNQRPLRVSDNGRFLVYDNGEPFFYLGDTAWELFHRTNREEADHYLRNRAAKGFTAIQAVVLAELDGLRQPNSYGHCPLIDNDPTKPNPAYFEHVDYVVQRCAELGMWMAMLPTWGDKWNQAWGVGPEVFTSENAEVFAEFLARRYADQPIIWMLGGDRKVETEAHYEILRGFARGIRKADQRSLITVHAAAGGYDLFPKLIAEDWLDFSGIQSGHVFELINNYYGIRRLYHESNPVKPCMELEPCYEEHPVMTHGWVPLGRVWYDALAVRRAAYWSLFEGGCGFTYGTQAVWQMWMPGRFPMNRVRQTWMEALDLPGAGQVRHIRALMERFSSLDRIPATDEMVLEQREERLDYIAATRDAQGSFALVYVPDGGEVTLNLEQLALEKLRLTWWNPRDGSALNGGTQSRSAQVKVTTPPYGPDWVLVIESA